MKTIQDLFMKHSSRNVDSLSGVNVLDGYPNDSEIIRGL
jgi:hypothetical protein